MMNTVLRTVAFGPAKTGLSVGYTLFNDTGVEIQARTTAGVTEMGTTGTYFAKVSLDTSFDTIIQWDTGEGSPKYVAGTILAGEASVQEETSRIRLIWNTLQNQTEIFNKLIDAMRGVKKPKPDNDGMNVFSQMMNKLDQLMSRKSPTISDIDAVLSARMASISRDFPKVNIPDYKGEFSSIMGTLAKIKTGLDMVPKTEADYKSDLKRLKDSLQVTIDKLPIEMKPLLGGIMVEVKRSMAKNEKAYQDFSDIRAQLDLIARQMKDHEAVMAKINESLESTINAVKPTKLLMDVYQMMAEGKNPGLRNTKMALGIRG